MRILQVVADGNPGGGTTHVLQILEAYRKTFELGLVTQNGSYLLREAERMGVSCFGLDFFKSRFDPTVSLLLRRIVLSFRPLLVHVHGSRAGYHHAIASPSIKTLYTVHGFHFVHKPPLVRTLARAAERLAFRRASRVLFVSHYDVGIARSHGLLSRDKSWAVVYPGVRLEDISRVGSASVHHVGFIGRLEYQKDPLLFLDVVRELPGYTASIVGGGSLETEVRLHREKQGLGNSVRMFGAVPHPESLRILSTMDAVVMTSRWEGLPIVLLEAMAFGVPVVALNVGGVSEIIENGVSGLLTETRSAESIVPLVLRVTKDPVLRTCIAQNARSRVASLFTVEKMLGEIGRIYEEAAQS